MSAKNKNAAGSKKDLREQLSLQLHMVLAGFKETVAEKKLQKLVKKAVKLLADGLHHNIKEPEPPKKKAAVKKAVKQKPPSKKP
jgi:hypothetical protein